MQDFINAWEIKLLANGKQVGNTEYVAVDETDGWVGGEDILLETIAHISTHQMADFIKNSNSYVPMSLQVQIVEVNPDDIF